MVNTIIGFVIGLLVMRMFNYCGKCGCRRKLFRFKRTNGVKDDDEGGNNQVYRIYDPDNSDNHFIEFKSVDRMLESMVVGKN